MNHPSFAKLTKLLVIPSLALAASPSLKATDDNWNVAGPADWATPGNWSNNTVPDVTVVGADEANISNAGSATITSAVPNVLNVYIGKNGGNTGTLTLAAGGSLTVTGTSESFKVGTDGGSGVFNQTGGTLTQAAGDFRLGNFGAGASGVYNLSGGTANVNSMRVGIGNLTQTGTLNQTGGAMTATGEFKVGSGSATGFYTLNGASATANLSDMRVGQDGSSNGTVTLSAGILTTTGETQFGTNGGTGMLAVDNAAVTANVTSLRIGQDANSIGIANHSAGTVANTSEMIVGLNGGNGIYNLSGTGVLTSTERVRVAVGNDAVGNFVQTGGNLAISSGQRLELSEDGGVATYSLSGGTLNVADDILVGGFGTGGTGTFTQTGGLATANRVRVAFSATKTGVVNLNGGVLAANSIEKESGGGTASLNFDGGTAQALSSNGNFITNFTTVDIQAGGATIDTNNFDTGIQSPLSGVGALTKIGLNQLKLAGANTYLGNTIINAGQLTILSSGSLTFDINANGVNNQVTGNGAGSFLVLGAFAFDLTDAASNGTWTVIDYANLSSVTFDPAFTVTGFSNAGGGSWTSGSFTFNQTTGVLTAVPEPATWVLMGSALFIVAIAAHRRRRRLSTTV